ncbi:hypothetical protein GCM10010269_51770 [Streptomyces humidus]|uniref:Uncharacterized protein n=1 Tax=Streptomyces humidus TaxID=52259 RepID=A0A918FYZ5_9ACTN|nr:hypothetical protein GCM10010269_51770 [Streptomyces humidus]
MRAEWGTDVSMGWWAADVVSGSVMVVVRLSPRREQFWPQLTFQRPACVHQFTHPSTRRPVMSGLPRVDGRDQWPPDGGSQSVPSG